MKEIIHTDYVTDITHKEDVPYLRTKLFDVNMRLFNSSNKYKALVLDACEYIGFLCLTKAEGYKLPHGFSGANAGIPWNIIAIARNRGEKTAYAQVMTNPKIINASEEMIESESNCGSIRLKEPITIKRHAWVDITWYSARDFAFCKARFYRENGGLTIQHEIDHNLGILITDRAI
jgi:peptide deformylase